MKKFLIILAVLVVVAVIGLPLFKKYTKSHSPPAEARYQKDGLMVKIDYCRPASKGRVIFGEKSAGALQPFGQYWRVGANEATVFETNAPLLINGKELKAGKYSLYAFPGPATWTIAFNTDWDRWGATAPNAQNDVLRVDLPVNSAADKKENFEISFEDPDPAGTAYADLHWDKSLVRIPFKKK
jgi:Protein of unknown function (DUF2911)